MISVIVTGGRAYADRARVFAVLDAIHAETPIALLRHGCATGADALAQAWAEEHVPQSYWPADWKKHGNAAGPIRNQAMVDAGADLVVAFPGGRGTVDCVRRARKAGIPVKEIEP